MRILHITVTNSCEITCKHKTSHQRHNFLYCAKVILPSFLQTWQQGLYRPAFILNQQLLQSKSKPTRCWQENSETNMCCEYIPLWSVCQKYQIPVNDIWSVDCLLKTILKPFSFAICSKISEISAMKLKCLCLTQYTLRAPTK